MKRVYTGQVLALVENMKNVLKINGIDSYIRNRYLSSAVGEIPPIESWPQLWVAEESFELAKNIIAEAEKEPPESDKIWICPKCGEEVEGQFFECWNCGTNID